MSALRDALEALFVLLERSGQDPPTRDVVLLELGAGAAVDGMGRLVARREQLRSPEAYEARFQELVEAGLPWINVSCGGVDNGKLIVTVEYPPSSSEPSPRTSVNCAGLSRQVREHGWDASLGIVLE